MSDAFWMALFGFLATALNIIISRKGSATSTKNQEVLEQVRDNVNGNLVKAVNRAEDEARRTSAPRVLIVDDNGDDILLAKIKLKKFGCAIFEARDAEEAENLLMSNIGPGRGFPFDFVLLDLKMPADNTEKVFRMFNEKAPRVPIVILTGQLKKSDGVDPSNTPRIQIIKPLSEAHVKSLLEQFSVPYRKPTELSEASNI